MTKLKVAMILALFGLLQSSTQHVIYLPIIMKYESKNLCGIEVWRNFTQVELLKQLNCQFVRYNPGTSEQISPYTQWQQANRTFQSAYMDSDISNIRAAGAIPIVAFFGNSQGTCSRLPQSEYSDFIDYILYIVNRYNLQYIEIWNEADFISGHPNLYGCWGLQYTQEYINLVKQVRVSLPSNVSIIASFALLSSETYQMIFPLVDVMQFYPNFILGIHSYEYYGISDPFTLSSKIQSIKSHWSGSIWITETNLLNVNCYDITFQKAQAEYIESVLNAVDMTIVYGLFPYRSSWKCAAVLQDDNSPAPSYEVIRQ